MRVYLPATPPLLRTWLAAGEAGALLATAVTAALREAYREGDAEELEWVAQTSAARASLELIAADPDSPPLRAVVAADVPDDSVRPSGGEDPATVELARPVPRSAWASALLDDPSVPGDVTVVAAAVRALRSSEARDLRDLQDRLDDAEAVELGWWAIQELPARLDGDGSERGAPGG